MRTEFLSFRSRAKRLSFAIYTAYFLPNTKHSQLAVVVPKKVNKLATTRNWLKRLTYDTLWPIIKDKKLAVVVVFKPLSLTKSQTTKEKVNSSLSSLRFEN